mgnify:FL=1
MHQTHVLINYEALIVNAFFLICECIHVYDLEWKGEESMRFILDDNDFLDGVVGCGCISSTS